MGVNHLVGARLKPPGSSARAASAHDHWVTHLSLQPSAYYILESLLSGYVVAWIRTATQAHMFECLVPSWRNVWLGLIMALLEEVLSLRVGSVSPCLHLPHPLLLLSDQYVALSYFSSILSACVPPCQDINYKLKKDVFKQRKVWVPYASV